MLSEDIDWALKQCFDCISDSSAWPAAMHSLALAVGADAVCLYAERAPELRLRLPASPVYQEFLADFMSGEWWLTDHRAQRGWRLLRGGGRVLVEHDLVSEDERRAMPVYHELYAKHDLTWWAAVSFRVGEMDWAMPLLRRESKGPFSDVQLLSALAPHLSRIVGLGQMMASARARTSVEILESCRRAAIVLDLFERCLAINGPAEAMLGREVFLSQGRLQATDPTTNRRLQGFLAAAVAARAPTELPDPIALQRRGRRPLVLDAVASPTSMGDLGFGFQAVLILTDLEQLEQGDPERLRSILGLTPAESRLAVQLLSGQTVSEASEELGLAKETARTHLKSLFAKTGTHRQSDLVRLLDRSSPTRRP